MMIFSDFENFNIFIQQHFHYRCHYILYMLVRQLLYYLYSVVPLFLF